jgi:hypothetical protein
LPRRQKRAFLVTGDATNRKERTVKKTVLLAAALGLSITFASYDTQAFPAFGGSKLVQPSDVTTVAGGCGPGFHRGPFGGCRPNLSPGWRCFWRYGRRICRW